MAADKTVVLSLAIIISTFFSFAVVSAETITQNQATIKFIDCSNFNNEISSASVTGRGEVCWEVTNSKDTARNLKQVLTFYNSHIKEFKFYEWKNVKHTSVSYVNRPYDCSYYNNESQVVSRACDNITRIETENWYDDWGPVNKISLYQDGKSIFQSTGGINIGKNEAKKFRLTFVKKPALAPEHIKFDIGVEENSNTISILDPSLDSNYVAIRNITFDASPIDTATLNPNGTPIMINVSTKDLIASNYMRNDCKDFFVSNRTNGAELAYQWGNLSSPTRGCNTSSTLYWVLTDEINATGPTRIHENFDYSNETIIREDKSTLWQSYSAVTFANSKENFADSTNNWTISGITVLVNKLWGDAWDLDGNDLADTTNPILVNASNTWTVDMVAEFDEVNSERHVWSEGYDCGYLYGVDDCFLVRVGVTSGELRFSDSAGPITVIANETLAIGEILAIRIKSNATNTYIYVGHLNGTYSVSTGASSATGTRWDVPFGFGKSTLTGTASTDYKLYHGRVARTDLSDGDFIALLKSFQGLAQTNETIGGVLPNEPPNTPSPMITPISPKTTDDLTCGFLATDPNADVMTANIDWMKNNITTLSYNITNIANGTTVNAILASGNTTKGELWNCQARLFDGELYSNYSNSTQVLILNSKPTHTAPRLEASTIDNTTNDELTCHNQSTFDADNDKITNIYTWLKNSQGLEILNLPFETNANDYSGAGHNGTIYGATFTAGKVGRALSFDGLNDKVIVGNLGIPANGIATIEGWFNFKQFASESSYRGLYSILYQHPVNNHLYITGTNDFFNVASHIQKNTWHHIVLTYSGNTSTAKLYLDNTKYNIVIQAGAETIPALSNFAIADTGYNEFFNGSIDEVKVYNKVLSEEQISKHYNLMYNKIVPQETSAGETYQCKITPNDAEEDGATLSSNSITINPPVYSITFRAIDSFTGVQLPSPIDKITCTNGLNVISEPNPAGPYKFFEGAYNCTFTKTYRYDKTITFAADANKTVDVLLSESHLTLEEHSWLEALYTCLIGGNCSAYNLWLSTNATVEKIWDQVKPTDQSVIVKEQIISQTLSPTSNISLNYSINVPTKEGYGTGDFLPLRIAYWFVDTNNQSCLSQDKQTDSNRAEAPFCIPLFAHTLGKVNYQTNFTVDLRPDLPDGTYNIVRRLEIDPPANNQPVWINYGQEVVGTITVMQSDGNILVNLIKTGEDKIKSNFLTGLTGAFALNLDAIANPSFALGVFITLAALSFILNGWFYFKRRKGGE